MLAVEYGDADSQSRDGVADERHWIGPLIRWVALAACAAFWIEIIRLAAHRF